MTPARQRVLVTSPRMTARPRPPSRSGTRDIVEQTGVGEVYTRSLLRTQLRIGLSAVALTVLLSGCAYPVPVAVQQEDLARD